MKTATENVACADARRRTHEHRWTAVVHATFVDYNVNLTQYNVNEKNLETMRLLKRTECYTKFFTKRSRWTRNPSELLLVTLLICTQSYIRLRHGIAPVCRIRKQPTELYSVQKFT